MAGRPSTYTPEIEARIFSRIEAGEGLNSICQDDDLPPAPTVRRWVTVDTPPGVSARYARARGIGLDHIAEDIIRLADESREGVKEGWRDGKPWREIGDMVERSRLQIDARKWLLSKLRPDKYGDRQILSGDAAAPIQSRVEVVFLKGDKDEDTPSA